MIVRESYVLNLADLGSQSPSISDSPSHTTTKRIFVSDLSLQFSSRLLQ